MVLSLLQRIACLQRGHTIGVLRVCHRTRTHYRDGTLRPMPRVLPFGLFGVLSAVIPGLFIGAAISKSVANFLEENDLFVPSDDDDDED